MKAVNSKLSPLYAPGKSNKERSSHVKKA